MTVPNTSPSKVQENPNESSPTFGAEEEKPSQTISQSPPTLKSSFEKNNKLHEDHAQIQSQFHKMKSELDLQRDTSRTDFYNKVHQMTYGDFQKHESPTTRLVKQKDE